MVTEWTSGVDWAGVLGSAGTVLLWVFFGLVVLGLFFLVWYFMSFKHLLVVRQIVNGRKQLRLLKWKVVKDRNGTRWLMTPFHKWFNGFKRSIPDSRAIDLGKRGRYHVEAWYDPKGDNLIWVNDSFDLDGFLSSYQVSDEAGVDSDDSSVERLVTDLGTGFAPLDTADRELIVAEMIRSEQYKTKNKLQIALQIAVYMVPIILVVVIAMTIGEVTSALSGYVGPVSEAATQIADSLERASLHLSDAQELSDDTGGAPN